MAIWIRNPLAVLVEDGIDAGGGLVVDGSIITELVPSGHEPTKPVTADVNADDRVILPGLINTHHHYYQTLTRAFGPRPRQGTLPLAQNPLPGLGRSSTSGSTLRGQACDVRAFALRLHHQR